MVSAEFRKYSVFLKSDELRSIKLRVHSNNKHMLVHLLHVYTAFLP